jgi:hypothetical protein
MERVLVCIISSTRGHDVTFAAFKRHVLDELHADLALAIAVDEHYDYSNPYWQHAKYRWTVPDVRDFAETFDAAQRAWAERHHRDPPDWRSILAVSGIWLDRIGPSDAPPSACGIALFCRWLLLQGLTDAGLLDRYDRFIITRSDFAWLGPHPPPSVLDPRHIWIPHGEDYEGLADRHLVAARADVADCLDLIEPILARAPELRQEMHDHEDWNSEQYLRHHLASKHRLDDVRRFPNVAYLARHPRDNSATWSRGRYDAALGHFVKYDTECDSASAMAALVRTRADWERGEWRQFDATAVAPRPASVRSRAMDAWYQFRWALQRPGRIRRFARLFQRVALGVGAAEDGVPD